MSTSIAIGSHPRRAEFYLAWMGATGMLDRDVLPAGGDDTRSILGAGMAACLGSAALFKTVHGLPQLPSAVSAWDLSMHAVTTGPTGERAIDVGSVAIVGAGAVGSAFAYWVNEIGHAGDWSVVDRDVAKLHNTNRCLTMTAADTGWPAAEGRPKVNLAAPLLAATPFLGWYDEWVSQATARPDLVLPLANEHGVRSAIGQRGDPVLVHATTSPAWWSQLHRHIAGRDDCIACRMPEAMPVFKCSSAPLPSTIVAREGDDAALPFVSAGAGLLLVSALLRLNDGFAAGERNLHWIDFRAARIHARSAIAGCQEGCRSRLPLEVIRAVGARSRWVSLIP